MILPLSALGGALNLVEVLWIALGGILFEICRRNFQSLLDAIWRGFYITIRIHPGDDIHDWVYSWLLVNCQGAFPDPHQTPPGPHRHQHANGLYRPTGTDSWWSLIWNRVWPIGNPPRDMDLSSARRKFVRGWHSDNNIGESYRDEAGKLRVVALPAAGRTLVIKRYKGGWSYGDSLYYISVSTFLGSHALLQDFLKAAEELHTAQDRGKLRIFSPRSKGYEAGSWGQSASKPGRPWESVVLPENVKEDLLEDAMEFLAGEAFYRERGLPYRRGYLLYGVPGSGKTSLVGALAAKLGLNIYWLSLGSEECVRPASMSTSPSTSITSSSLSLRKKPRIPALNKALNDSSLQSLLSSLPNRCILLIEDIDCAIQSRKRGKSPLGPLATSNDADPADPDSTDRSEQTTDKDDDNDTGATGSSKSKKKEDGEKGSKVTMSGLLNALDGVASADGRLLFCTTNHLEKLDPALCRPGRCDVWIEFKHATTSQINALFAHFYAPKLTSTRDEHEYDPAAQVVRANHTTQDQDQDQDQDIRLEESREKPAEQADGRSPASTDDKGVAVALTHEPDGRRSTTDPNDSNDPIHDGADSSETLVDPASPLQIEKSGPIITPGINTPLHSPTLTPPPTPMVGVTGAEPVLNLVARSDVDHDHDHNHDPKHDHTLKPLPSPLSHLSSSPSISPSHNPNPSAIAETKVNITFLADQFANLIPSGTVSVAALQGYLLRHKLRPEVAVREAPKWVEGGFQQGPKTAEAVKRLEP